REGDLDGAHAALLANLEALAGMAVAAPKDSKTRATLWQVHLELAREAHRLGDSKTGVAEAAKALSWLDEYVALAGDDAGAAELGIQGFRDLGLTSLDLKDQALARKIFQRGAAFTRAFVAKRPT